MLYLTLVWLTLAATHEWLCIDSIRVKWLVLLFEVQPRMLLCHRPIAEEDSNIYNGQWDFDIVWMSCCDCANGYSGNRGPTIGQQTRHLIVLCLYVVTIIIYFIQTLISVVESSVGSIDSGPTVKTFGEM